MWAIISSLFKQQPPVNVYLSYKTRYVNTYITTNTRIEARAHLQCDISAFSPTSKVRRHPRSNEPVYLQCKPRHHQHLIHLIQDHSTDTVRATTGNT